MIKSSKPTVRLWYATVIAGSVMTPSVGNMADLQYIIRLNNFKIFDTSSPHTDTDCLPGCQTAIEDE
jgi:hypothetical protein